MNKKRLRFFIFFSLLVSFVAGFLISSRSPVIAAMGKSTEHESSVTLEFSPGTADPVGQPSFGDIAEVRKRLHQEEGSAHDEKKIRDLRMELADLGDIDSRTRIITSYLRSPSVGKNGSEALMLCRRWFGGVTLQSKSRAGLSERIDGRK